MRTVSRVVNVMFVFLALTCGSAHAERRQIFYSVASGQPSWKLENYMADVVAIWNTPSSCNNGFITFPSSMSAADKNRFYATLMAAKTSNATMFIYYDDVPGSCMLVSFGLL
ncbi:hypothetical protein [Janthinobacterium lividum]|uniref:hypothetical protein n=1 Tax=Janthinobacterium lividum TaxID=29581 RepID=UPI001408C85E|nr:hypothetical protein [Janthinobacterium lividum]NHQ90517.1 hypothetical protein [Janthinobacterium lividum]